MLVQRPSSQDSILHQVRFYLRKLPEISVKSKCVVIQRDVATVSQLCIVIGANGAVTADTSINFELDWTGTGTKRTSYSNDLMIVLLSGNAGDTYTVYYYDGIVNNTAGYYTFSGR